MTNSTDETPQHVGFSLSDKKQKKGNHISLLCIDKGSLLTLSRSISHEITYNCLFNKFQVDFIYNGNIQHNRFI